MAKLFGEKEVVSAEIFCAGGKTIKDYIRKGGSAYNSDFDKLIRRLAPLWFKGRKS